MTQLGLGHLVGTAWARALLPLVGRAARRLGCSTAPAGAPRKAGGCCGREEASGADWRRGGDWGLGLWAFPQGGGVIVCCVPDRSVIRHSGHVSRRAASST